MRGLANADAAPPRHDLARYAVVPAGAPDAVQLRVTPSVDRTGPSDRLKTGIEALSGASMDDVRVHRQSDRPARVGALAYAKGTDIYLAPGQDHHLPHEAWHVVQQKQGRVVPTIRIGGERVNDDAALEREADAMGKRAADLRTPGPPPPGVALRLGTRTARGRSSA